MEKIVRLNSGFIHRTNYDVVIDPAYWYDIRLNINGYPVSKIILYDDMYEESFVADVYDGVARFDRLGFNKNSTLTLIAITEDDKNTYTLCNFLYIDEGLSKPSKPYNVTIEYNTIGNISNLQGKFHSE